MRAVRIRAVRIPFGIVTAYGAALVGAVAARSLVDRGVRRRRVGRPVQGVSLDGVLDAGGDVWRGPAPTPVTYRELADAGCTLIVDLRAEADRHRAAALARQSAMTLLVLPTINGRVPTAAHLERFVYGHESKTGATYVHCEAGEGRTGAIVGAYQVRTGTRRVTALADALSVGSLTFAQIAYVVTAGQVPAISTVIDRAVDRPTEYLFDIARRR